MTQKLLLAEGLDLLRQCEIKEYELDKTRECIRSSNKYKNELSRLVQGYTAVYEQFLRGVEILNYIRHQALDDRNPQTAQYSKNLSEFCAGKMSAYMDRCDNVIRKLDDIMLPLDQVDLITKDGYVPEDTLFIQDGTSYPLTRKENTLAREFTLMDGTYVLTVKNKDNYSIAAPGIDIVITVTPQRGSGAEPQRVSQSVPTECAWRKVIGVIAAATLQLEVRSSGIRDAHVDVLLQKWRPVNTDGGAGASAGPGDSPFAGQAKLNFSSDFASVKKPGAGGADVGGFGNADPSRPPQQSQQQFYGPDSGNQGAAAAATGVPSPAPPPSQNWPGGLPAIPDDDLAALANYNVPHNQLPQRGGGSAGGPSAEAYGAQRVAPPQPQQQEDPWDALAHMNVPHVGAAGRGGNAAATRVPDPVEVNPAGKNCKERLQKVREMLNAWPAEGVPMANLPSDKQRLVQSVYALMLPRELN